MIDGYEMMKKAGGGWGGRAQRLPAESLRKTLETFLQNATKSQKPKNP